jgi:hypothetical protein
LDEKSISDPLITMPSFKTWIGTLLNILPYPHIPEIIQKIGSEAEINLLQRN